MKQNTQGCLFQCQTLEQFLQSVQKNIHQTEGVCFMAQFVQISNFHFAHITDYLKLFIITVFSEYFNSINVKFLPILAIH